MGAEKNISTPRNKTTPGNRAMRPGVIKSEQDLTDYLPDAAEAGLLS